MALEVGIQQSGGSYQLTSKLGQGGFANIYLGTHMYLTTNASIKVLNIWQSSEMVYEWLCGQQLFQGTALGVCSQHLYTEPLSLRGRIPSIPSTVEQVVFKALAKDPSQRFAQVLNFASALEHAGLVEEYTAQHGSSV